MFTRKTHTQTHTITHTYEYTSSSHIDKLELFYTYIHKAIFMVFQLGLESVIFLKLRMDASFLLEFGTPQIILTFV